MSSRRIEQSLQDILNSSEAIQEFLNGITLETYIANLMIRSAVERQLQILTEAAFRLGPEAPKVCPEIDWRAIRGLGNFLRHEYENVTDQEIWNTIHNKLPELQAAVIRALQSVDEPSGEDL